MNKILALFASLLNLLTPDLARKAVDAALDVIEAKALTSKSKWDDKIILPICEAIRRWFDIPDNDKP